MKVTVEIDGKKIELNGEVNKDDFSISLQSSSSLSNYFQTIYAYDNNKKVTLLYCRNVEASYSETYRIYRYKISVVIDDWIDIKELTIESLYFNFFETNYLLRKGRIKYNRKSINISEKVISKKVYRNSDIDIELIEHLSNKQDISTFTSTYDYKIHCKYSRGFKENEIYEKYREIENVFGFIIGRKMNLISMSMIDDHNQSYNIYYPYMVKKKDCDKDVYPFINNMSITRKIVKKYFEDDHIKATIDNYYEYIFNNLDIVFKFTSLCNAIENISSHDELKKKITNYIDCVDNERNSKIEEYDKIINKLDKEDRKLINESCHIKKLSLKHKLYYLLLKKRDRELTSQAKTLITRINKTRNYYVHGEKRDGLLKYEEIGDFCVVLQYSLYICLLETCGIDIENETVMLVKPYMETIERICKRYGI